MKYIIAVLCFSLIPIEALKLRKAECIVEWEANVTDLPCWVEGKCPGKKFPFPNPMGPMYTGPGNGAIGSSGKMNVRGNTLYPGQLVQPKTVQQIIDVVKSSSKILMVATGHSSGGALEPVDPKATIMSLWRGFRSIKLDICKLTVTVGVGVAALDIKGGFDMYGMAMPTWLIDKGFSFLGLAQTSAVGVTTAQNGLAWSQLVEGISAVNGKGEKVSYVKGDPKIRAWTMTVSELGAIYSVTMRVVKNTWICQECQNFVTWDEMSKAWNLDKVPYPGIDKPGNNAGGLNNIFPVQSGCRAVQRSLVVDGYPSKCKAECSNFSLSEFSKSGENLNPGFDLIKLASNIPQLNQAVLDLAFWIGEHKPELVRKHYGQIAKPLFLIQPSLEAVLPQYPFYPDPPLLQCMTYEGAGTQVIKWNLPANMPQWMELYIRAEEVDKYFLKLRKVQKCAAKNGVTFMLNGWGMVATQNIQPRAYLSPNDADVVRSIVTLMGAPFAGQSSKIDQVTIETFYETLICMLQCDGPYVEVHGFHLGTHFPLKFLTSPGIVFPQLDNLEKFFAVEADEDPFNKFESKYGKAFRERLTTLKGSPNATICGMCNMLLAAC
eukprot:gnl/MRDRNA2_/MRDRNA2_86278_c0_seq1.p1 gnl/MRDRNA2_/MRDRNA2_86278_c0~~gnl/MRDRNA2_/MRDRNA2_86278_c0_seq1.p1  ORF type:complete len:604 (+),score=76.71 gnl/MRDRNA2_/MRDRNA2_86278_c0_seq1:94-1905(+)